MAEWETIQERLISGKGILKVPTDVVKNRAYVLFATVVREPRNSYANYNWNPPRSRYGNLTFFRRGYVVATTPIEYKKQVFDGINDIAGQSLIAIKCAYNGILQTFVNLGTGLAGTPGGIGLSVTPITDLIQDYESLRLAWDEVRLQCYADTAISLRLDRIQYDSCDPDRDDDNPGPDSPDPVTPIPPGDPIETDAPYDEDTSDNGNTAPYPGDSPPTPPPAPHSITVRTQGLNSDCSAAPTVFTTVYTARTIAFETATIPPGQPFAGCSYKFLVVDGVSNYPDLTGGSAGGTGEILDPSP